MKGWMTMALATALVLGAGASASTTQGSFAVKDSGRMTCPAFAAARAANSPDYQRAIGFIEGYLTAANRYEPNTFDLAPWHNSAAFGLILAEHCKKQPKDSLALAAQRLVGALQPLRLAEPSKLIEVGTDKNKTILYEMILKRAQSALARKGLYRGTATGQFDEATRVAIAAFQKSVTLEPTGVPDPATLWMLLNP